MIGILGDIAFEASADLLRTWRDASREGAARWAKHEVFAGKPLSEFIGPGLDSIDLNIRLDIERGVIPRDELRRMRRARDTGEVMQFTIGGELVGNFKLENLAETWTRFSRNGVLTTAVVSIRLEEYQ